ncbi:MAG: zinc ribbon domain-containing protein [Oscillospiraceae bacterium]|nr:zinc ribbon domain-containing protein [Oscillospiraceae bacterium]
MIGPTNCPNCGAPIGLDDRCSYCGTLFIDISNIPIDEPFYMKLRLGMYGQGRVITSKVFCSGVSFEMSIDSAPAFELTLHPLGPITEREK